MPRQFTPEDLAKAKARAAEARAERRDTRTVLPNGALVYKDQPPGVGWVAHKPGHALRWYRDKASAILWAQTGDSDGKPTD